MASSSPSGVWAPINSYRYPLPCTHRCKGINPQVSPPITLRPVLTHCLCYKGDEVWTHTWLRGLLGLTCASQHFPCAQNPSAYVKFSGHSPCVECEDTRCIGTYLWCYVSRISSSADRGKVEHQLCVEYGHTPNIIEMYSKNLPARCTDRS